MNSLISFLESDFNTQRDQWERTLLSELKISEIGNKASKKLLSGLEWPTLSLDACQKIQLTSTEWKKASTTYVDIKDEAELQEDLNSGVRNFFFFHLDEKKWKIVEKSISSFQHKDEVEVILLGDKKFTSNSFKVISQLISGKTAHDQGAHAVQELAFMTRELIENLESSKDIHIGIYVDSLFFQNIAKLRAARLLATRILQESNIQKEIKIVALTSYRGWTIFERYSNILRNETAVASSFIGGADHIQSSGYNSVIELESDASADEHRNRSLRMARNTSHVLALESLLGIVQDASYGSYHLENLTQTFCEESWKLMQRLLNGEDLSDEINEVRNQRLLMLKQRKSIISGINDYPDVKEKLDLKLKAPFLFRTPRIFEELRLRMEQVKKPVVYIALFGEYGSLNGRLNFVKNYFELLGLNVHEAGHSVTDINEFKKDLISRKEEIIVLCSLDDKYPEISSAALEVKVALKFIAGKTEMAGYKNLFAGQNIYEVLEEIVTSFEGRQA